MRPSKEDLKYLKEYKSKLPGRKNLIWAVKANLAILAIENNDLDWIDKATWQELEQEVNKISN